MPDVSALVKSELCTTELLTTDFLRPRRGDHVIQGKNPETGALWDLRVEGKFASRTCRHGRGSTLELTTLVPGVLLDPTRIYQGVRDEGENEWLCYVGIPAKRFRADGGEFQPDDRDLLLAFINVDRVLYNFRMERSEKPFSGIPMNEAARFKRRVFP